MIAAMAIVPMQSEHTEGKTMQKEKEIGRTW